MLQYILTNVLMLALGAILYLAARSLPRLADEEETERQYSLIERWVMSDIPHRVDQAVNLWAGKFFRKVKIYLLRLDNYLTQQLKRINNGEMGLKGGPAKPKIDFEQVMEVRTQEYVGPDRRKTGRRLEDNSVTPPPAI
jgi:hypothetical protein